MKHNLHDSGRQTMLMLLCSTLIVSLVLSTPGMALALPIAAAKPQEPAKAVGFANNPSAVSAKSALLMDEASGQVLWSKQIDQVVAPASLTKLLTLKLVFESLDSGKVKLGDLVLVSERAWKTGGSRMFLRVGTKVTLEELIKGITVASGNDACIAAAEFIGGTVENFVVLMNERAQAMGLSNSQFVDPHGLSDANKTSARDIANLARVYIRDHPKSLVYHSMKAFTFVPAGGAPITQSNRNKLLGTYDGADGLKTGHTEAAGYNLVATAERAGTRFIAVALGVQARTEPLGEELRAREVAKLLDYGYGNFQTRVLAAKGEHMGDIRVFKGREDSVKVGAASEVKYTVEKNASVNVSKKTTLESKLIAPIKKGQTVGSVSIRVNDQEVQNVPVVTLDEIPAGGLFKRFVDSLRLIIQRSVKIE